MFDVINRSNKKHKYYLANVCPILKGLVYRGQMYRKVWHEMVRGKGLETKGGRLIRAGNGVAGCPSSQGPSHAMGHKSWNVLR